LKKILNIIGFFCLLVINLQAQYKNTVVFLPQGYVLESLNGYGFSHGVISTISNISSGNPASLSDFQRLSLGVSGQYDTKINTAWIAGIGYQRVENKRPQSAGFVLPHKNFRLGFGISQKYSTALDFGEVEITTVEEPEGTGETFNVTHNTFVQSKSALIAYSLQNVFSNEKISVAVQYNINTMCYEASFWKLISRNL